MIKKSALALAVLAAGVSAQAQEADALSVTVDVTYVSDYVFRGMQLATASVQPSVEAAYGDFYAGLWHSSALSGSTGATETDLYAGYGFAATDTVTVDAGVTAYTYNGGSSTANGTGNTVEAYVGASVDTLLTPSVYAYYDFDLKNVTVEGSIGYSIPAEAINSSLDLSGKVGYVSLDDAINGEDSYFYCVAGVALPYSLSETATLTLGVDYVYNTEDVVAGFGGGDEDAIIGKVGISIGF